MVSLKYVQRVRRDLADFHADPPDVAPQVCLRDSELDKILFLVRGPRDTIYDGGEYVLEILLPAEYPIAPPTIRMLTPSGRFTPGADIGTSFTGFHPESWAPSYTLTTLVVSLVSFMTDDAGGCTGSMNATPEVRRQLAAASAAYNATKGFSALFEAPGGHRPLAAIAPWPPARRPRAAIAT